MKQILLGVAVAVAIGWGAAGRHAEAAQTPWITFSRSDCFGVCPEFTLRVFARGRVEYEGKRFVIQRGRRTGQLSPVQLGRLRKVAAKIAQLDTHCCDCRDRTDHPWTYIEIADRGQTRSISHYHGCQRVPEEVDDLEEAFMSITGAERWVGSAAERSRQKWGRGRR